MCPSSHSWKVTDLPDRATNVLTHCTEPPPVPSRQALAPLSGTPCQIPSLHTSVALAGDRRIVSVPGQQSIPISWA